MKHIFEVAASQLEEVIQIINQYWEEVSERPLAKEEWKEKAYWEEVHRKGRIFLYKEDSGEIAALLSLLKTENQVTIDLFFIVPAFKNQGIGLKMLRFTERITIHWSADHIRWFFHDKEDIEKHFPIFQQLGYVIHCPIKQKGCLLLEKKVM